MDVGRPPDPLGMDHTREIIGRREISAASFSRATSTVYPEAHFSKTTPHRTSLFIVYFSLGLFIFIQRMPTILRFD